MRSGAGAALRSPTDEAARSRCAPLAEQIGARAMVPAIGVAAKAVTTLAMSGPSAEPQPDSARIRPTLIRRVTSKIRRFLLCPNGFDFFFILFRYAWRISHEPGGLAVRPPIAHSESPSGCSYRQASNPDHIFAENYDCARCQIVGNRLEIVGQESRLLGGTPITGAANQHE